MKITKEQLTKMIQEELSATLQEEADNPFHKAVAYMRRARELAGQVQGGHGRDIRNLINGALGELQSLSENEEPVNEEAYDCIRDLMKIEGYTRKKAEYICRYGGSDSRLSEVISDEEKEEMLAQLSSMAQGTDESFWDELKKLLGDADGSVQLESDSEAHEGGETTVPVDEDWKGDPKIKQLDKYGKAEMTKAELCKRRTALRDKEDRTDAETTELRRVNFALRSRQKGSKFGKIDC
jgi:signal transduction histidine kinase